MAVIYGKVKAVTGGVHRGRDVLKSMMAGATVAMTTSCLLRHGIAHAREIEREMDDRALVFQPLQRPRFLSDTDYGLVQSVRVVPHHDTP